MITNTIILIVSIFTIFLVLTIVFWFVLKKRKAQKTSLTAIIDIYPSGKSNVEFNPYTEVSELKLMKIAILYLVKIRYISSSEPDEIFEMFKGIFKDIVGTEVTNEKNHIQYKIEDYANSFRETNGEIAATKNGERFIVNLIEGETMDYVDTQIPFPSGLVANLPISVIFLFEEVFSKIPSENRERFEQLLKFVSSKLFLTKEMNLNDMTRLNSVITNSFKFTEELAKENTN